MGNFIRQFAGLLGKRVCGKSDNRAGLLRNLIMLGNLIREFASLVGEFAGLLGNLMRVCWFGWRVCWFAGKFDESLLVWLESLLVCWVI